MSASQKSLADLLENRLGEKISLISFDLFDTLIDREGYELDAVINSTCTFAIRRWKWDTGVNYAQLRHSRFHISNLVHASEVMREMTSKEIWNRIVRSKSAEQPEMAEQITTSIHEFELRVERLLLRIKPGAKATLEAAHRSGRKVVIFSDMYYTREELLEIPCIREISEMVDGFHVSSDLQVKKSDGSAYQYLCEEYGVKPEAIFHIGDNKHSDVAMARKSGVGGHHYVESSPITRRVWSASADPVINLREGLHAASYLLAFRAVEWAMKQNYRRVCFLTRDGDAFQPYVEDVAAYYSFPIKTEKVLLDRFSLHLAVINHTAAEKDWVEKWVNNKAARKRRLLEIHRQYTEASNSPSIHTSNGRIIIQDSGMFFEMLRHFRESILTHIDRIFPEDGRTILIDVGYGGSCMRMIANLALVYRPVLAPRIAYFSLMENAHFNHNEAMGQPCILHHETILDWQKLELGEKSNFAMLEPWFKNRGMSETTARYSRDTGFIIDRDLHESDPHHVTLPITKDHFDTTHPLEQLETIAHFQDVTRRILGDVYQAFNQPTKDLAAYYAAHLPSECTNGEIRSVIYEHKAGTEFPSFSQLLDDDYWVQGSLVHNAWAHPGNQKSDSLTINYIEHSHRKNRDMSLKKRVARLRKKLLRTWKKS